MTSSIGTVTEDRQGLRRGQRREVRRREAALADVGCALSSSCSGQRPSTAVQQLSFELRRRHKHRQARRHQYQASWKLHRPPRSISTKAATLRALGGIRRPDLLVKAASRGRSTATCSSAVRAGSTVAHHGAFRDARVRCMPLTRAREVEGARTCFGKWGRARATSCDGALETRGSGLVELQS